ncbi:MAG: prolipoprotein diacylglyceryl transferase [Mycoplasma sp.]|nr:prolipoprotein diacylglyceryl transferase [Candidatus Hennigella equi]
MLGSWIDTPPLHPWTPDVKIAFWNIPWYGIFVTLGFIVAIVASCLKMWKRYKISTEPFYWFILIGVPLAILGARIGSCILGDAQWSSFWDFQGGGLAIEWGVVLVVLAAFIYFPLILKLPRYRVRDELGASHEVKKVSFWMYADAVIPCILLAQFIGRWGNYFNREVYGLEVTSEGLAHFLHDCLPYMWVDDHYVQPLFLWEGLANLGMFFVMYFGFEFIKQRKAGDMAAFYFVWYGALRLGLEGLREQQYTFMMTYVMSGIFVGLGAFFIIINHLLISKVRDKKIWHTLFKFGPMEVFRMIGAGWNPQQNIRYQDKKYVECIRKPVEMIYFGAW